MARLIENFNPAEWVAVGGSSRRYKNVYDQSRTISRRDYDFQRSNRKLIKRRSEQFSAAVKTGKRLSKENAQRVQQRLREVASQIAALEDEQAQLLAIQALDLEFEAADIGFDVYTPAELEEASTRSLPQLQKRSRKRTRHRAKTRRKMWQELSGLDKEPNNPETLAKRRDLLEQLGLRDDVPHWVPPGFSKKSKRPDGWRPSRVPKKWRMAW